jgi:hypothetical protein
MPLSRLLEGGAFDQSDINRMGAAYEAALQLLRLYDKDDPLCELVARKIIEVMQSGVRDPSHLCAKALRELGVTIPD